MGYKFRAYDNRSSKMYDFAVIGFNGSIHVHGDTWGTDHLWVDIGCGCEVYDDYDGEVTLMQFIDLLDENGKEFCEGDIVDCTSQSDDHGQKDSKEKLIVRKWMGNACLCFNGQETGVPLYPLIVNHRLEIVGNIHENPELVQ